MNENDSLRNMAMLLQALPNLVHQISPSMTPGGTAPAVPAARPYQSAPNTLMGYPRNGPPKGYENSKYPYNLKVRVDFGDRPPIFNHPLPRYHEDEIKGMNMAHALERAYRNWPNAVKIEPIE